MHKYFFSSLQVSKSALLNWKFFHICLFHLNMFYYLPFSSKVSAHLLFPIDIYNIIRPRYCHIDSCSCLFSESHHQALDSQQPASFWLIKLHCLRYGTRHSYQQLKIFSITFSVVKFKMSFCRVCLYLKFWKFTTTGVSSRVGYTMYKSSNWLKVYRFSLFFIDRWNHSYVCSCIIPVSNMPRGAACSLSS